MTRSDYKAGLWSMRSTLKSGSMARPPAIMGISVIGAVGIQDNVLIEFIEILDQYIHWYAEKRIKVSLGGVSPVGYRKAQGLAA